MNDLIGVWFGFIGIVVGAIITFITEMIIRKNQMTFEMSVKIREDLMTLNHELVSIQSRVLTKHDLCDRTKCQENILALKKEHEDVMEAYKVYRIHLGDLKAYELDSAIYKYYYELAKHNNDPLIKLSMNDYKASYIAIKDAVGLMINGLRFELIKINSIKKTNKNDLKEKRAEYLRYSQNIINWISDEKIFEMLRNFVREEDNFEPIHKAFDTVYRRIAPFYEEINKIDKDMVLPNIK